MATRIVIPMTIDQTPRRGEKSELAVASELMSHGYGVSLPFGHNHLYDLIVDKNGSLYRVQVKTAKNEEGALVNRQKAFDFTVSRLA